MTKSTGVGRGGRRPGAGRKSPDGEPFTGGQIGVSVDEEVREFLFDLGDGSLSVGLRRALRELMELRSSPPPKTAPRTENVQSIAKPAGSRVVSLKTNPFLKR